MNLKFLIGTVLSVPLLPWMYFSGRKVRRTVPVLEEATETIGSTGEGTNYFDLLVLGESTMAGVGVSSQNEGFAGQLSKLLASSLSKKVNWEVKARSGYTAKSVVKKIVPKIEMTRPDLIVIGLGANDAFTLNTPKKWSIAVVELIAALQMKFPETSIVFANMPPIKQFPALPFILKLTMGNLIQLFGTELSKLTPKYTKVYYNEEKISFKTWGPKYNLADNPETYFSDGIHPSELTYKLWAMEMHKFISNKVL